MWGNFSRSCVAGRTPGRRPKADIESADASSVVSNRGGRGLFALSLLTLQVLSDKLCGDGDANGFVAYRPPEKLSVDL